MFLAKRSSWSSKNIPLLLKLDSGRNSSPLLYLLRAKEQGFIVCLLSAIWPFGFEANSYSLSPNFFVSGLEK